MHKPFKSDVPTWHTISKELDKFHSQTNLEPSSSQESVRNLYDPRDRKRNSSASTSATRVHSGISTITSCWSRTDIPSSSKATSKK